VVRLQMHLRLCDAHHIVREAPHNIQAGLSSVVGAYRW
jgi:hypothetical protein